MQGIEKSYRFYNDFLKGMLEEKFPEYVSLIAVGLVGHGSECFGYDDDLSEDHDFSPECNIWVSEETYRKTGFNLERAYDALLKECGIKPKQKSLQGNIIRGVKTVGDFYRFYTGRPGAPEEWRDWLYTPSFYFAEATNGKVFTDPEGLFTSVREKILNGMPEDVRLKKISSKAFLAAQSGQYNFLRSYKHGEIGAAMISLNRFVENTAELIFLLNGKHMPYYKWMFRAMDDLTLLKEMKEPLEFLLSYENDENGIQVKADVVEDICHSIIREFRAQNISDSMDDYLEGHAYSINNHIKDGDIRNLDITI